MKSEGEEGELWDTPGKSHQFERMGKGMSKEKPCMILQMYSFVKSYGSLRI